MVSHAMIEPTKEERSNGWTAETLTAYLTQRESEQKDYALSGKQARDARPTRAQTEYDPHNWLLAILMVGLSVGVG